MKKIRQWNDIDITVHLHNGEGQALDPTLCKDMTVYLTCGTKKFFISEFEKFTDGNVKFRFKADEQTRIGVYNITVTATTADDRTFTTDVCDAFNLVACSCLAGQDDGEVNIETIEVNATFDITAWGVISDIVTYEMPSNWIEVGKQYPITQDNFHDIFGSEDELLKNLENKHVRLKIPTDELGMLIIDVTTSMQLKYSDETAAVYVINFNGNASVDPQNDILIFHALDVRCRIGIEKLTDGTYNFVFGTFEIIQKEGSVTTEKIADKAVTLDKIADGVLPQECAFSINQISNAITVIGTFNDKLSMVYPAILEIESATEYGSFAYLPSERIGIAIFNQYSLCYEYKDGTFTLSDKLQHATGGGSGVADVGITGTLNVTNQNSIVAAQDLITKPYGVAFYLITDSNGKLPSKNQEAVNISASIEKLLSFRSPNPTVNNILDQVSIDNFKPRGFNVGDIIALSRVPVSIDTLVEYLGLSSAIATALKLLGLSEIEIYQYKIWATNDAKWSNFQNKDGSVVTTGVKGLMSVWDKEQVDKVPNLENIATANDLSTKYGYGTYFDNCLTTGVCAYSPANIGGVTENFTLIVQASSTVDSGGFYSIIQTAYGRTGSVYNRVFKRMIFYNPTTGAKEFHDWVEITSSNAGSTKYFTTSCAPDVIFSTLEAAKVNGFAEVSSETEDGTRGYTFKGYFNFVPTDGSPYYMGVGMITYNDTNLSEPAILMAHPYNHTQIIGATRIADLEARIKALEDKLV